tara:strand:+ start:493 stop:837 length:345 start_codon:yes stop_codon:yes gene_type:complete
MRLVYCLALLAIVFVMMYDPRSGFLERFVPGISAGPMARPVGPRDPPVNGMTLNQVANAQLQGNGSNCCAQTDYLAGNPTQCEPAHFRGVQFASMDYGCPVKHPEAYMGAIIGS